jgi:hypothetical protein
MDDPILAGERTRLREATARVRTADCGGLAEPAVSRSIERVATRLERDPVGDPDAREHAARIRDIVQMRTAGEVGHRDLRSIGGRSQSSGQDMKSENTAPLPSEKAERYKQLENELRRRDDARARQRTRDHVDREKT